MRSASAGASWRNRRRGGVERRWSRNVLAGECPSNLVRDALPSLSRGAHTPVLRVAVCGY